jgi:catechol 2,3-dioxygenase-like lactoylglutathione lyase family enzyme
MEARNVNIRFNHLAIRVKDMDTSVHFLKAVMGPDVKVIELADPSGPGPRVTLIDDGTGVLFDLFSEAGAAPEKGPEYGLIHYCIGTDDVDAAFAAALGAGAVELMAPEGDEIRHCYVYDPNGDVCEFVNHDWVAKLPPNTRAEA